MAMYVVIRKCPIPGIERCQRFELDEFGFLYKVRIREDGTSLGPDPNEISLPWEALEPYIAQVGSRKPDMEGLHRGVRNTPRRCPVTPREDFDFDEVING